MLGGSDKYQRSYRRVNRRGPGLEGNTGQTTDVRANFEDNFEGDWKELSWITTRRTMRSIRMVLAAVLLTIPFPDSR